MREECEYDADLSALLDGELSASEQERLRRHLHGCVRCSDEVADVRRVRAELRSLPHRAVPAGLLDAVTVEVASGGDRLRRRRAERLAIAGLLAAIAFTGALAWSGSSEPSRTVEVPVDAFVSDHVVRTSAGPLLTPVVTQE